MVSWGTDREAGGLIVRSGAVGEMKSGLLKSDFRSKICHSADIRVGLLVEELGTDEGLGCSAVASVARLQVRGKFRAHESLSRVLACSYCGLYLKLWRAPAPVHTQFSAGFGQSRRAQQDRRRKLHGVL